MALITDCITIIITFTECYLTINCRSSLIYRLLSDVMNKC